MLSLGLAIELHTQVLGDNKVIEITHPVQEEKAVPEVVLEEASMPPVEQMALPEAVQKVEQGKARPPLDSMGLCILVVETVVLVVDLGSHMETMGQTGLVMVEEVD